jgi:DNA-binding transcriptional MerR regulator
MMPTAYSIALYRDDEHAITIDELARAVGVHPELVERFVACGLVEPTSAAGRSTYFDAAAVRRVHAICRLRRDVGANLASVALILDLVERVDGLEREVARLRALL